MLFTKDPLTEIEDPSKIPAVMPLLKAERNSRGDCILPSLFDDDPSTPMPGNRQGVRTELAQAYTLGEHPRLEVDGANVGVTVWR